MVSKPNEALSPYLFQMCLSKMIHVYSLETGKPIVCVGSSPGDFTCVNLRDSTPHLLVCGNKDRRFHPDRKEETSSLAFPLWLQPMQQRVEDKWEWWRLTDSGQSWPFVRVASSQRLMCPFLLSR
ncbi:hypothetical protein AMECASPLE_033387 [Ameca splendens]|uniref:Uncharacterized protein n=1 Tax=Ameca splendens TaxID=208324 RepID=A0ABV0ZG33_9TELE